MTAFNAKARAEHCVSDLDGELNTYTNDDDEDCVRDTVFDTLERYIKSAFESGRASRDAEVEALTSERDTAQANYRFMVERAADEKLDGYRELAAQLAEKEAECERLRSAMLNVMYHAVEGSEIQAISRAALAPASKGESDD